MATIQQSLEFLQTIYQDLEKHRAIARKNELRDANRFNPFRFFTTDENGLSAILAFLLNPNETHGQGDLLLNAFLKKMRLHSFLGYETVRVSLEKNTQHGRRRHDILIEGFINQKCVWVLSIENKLRDASDQNNQINDYLKDLEKYTQPHCLIYLPSFYREPSEQSISQTEFEKHIQQNTLKILDADGLMDWLENATIFAPKISQFTEFLIQFLKEDIMGETTESNALVEQIVANPNHLDAALQVIAAEQQIREHLWHQLQEQLGEKCRAHYPKMVKEGWVTCSLFQPSSRYMWLGWVIQIGTSETGIGIEFDGTYYHNCKYGTWIDKKQYRSCNAQLIQKFAALHKEMGSGKSDSWEFWKWLDNDLRHWESSTWLRIPTSELANEIFEKWQPLLDIFEENLPN